MRTEGSAAGPFRTSTMAASQLGADVDPAPFVLAAGGGGATLRPAALHMHPTSVSVDVASDELDRPFKPGSTLERGVELSIERSLRVHVRVHEAVLGFIFATVARDLEREPVISTPHATVTLSKVLIKPVVGGISFAATFEACLAAPVIARLGLEPVVRGRFIIPTSPLWLETGIAHVRVRVLGPGPAHAGGCGFACEGPGLRFPFSMFPHVKPCSLATAPLCAAARAAA